MSRTRKDRPYWVRLNDKREPKAVFHSHGKIGNRIINFLGEEYRYADHCTGDEPAVHRSNRDRRNLQPCEPIWPGSTGPPARFPAR